MELPDFPSLQRITSDCKPFASGGRLAICTECSGVQKFADAKWLGEIERIYDQYETYSLTGPLDQIVLDPQTNTVRPRCEILAEKLTAIDTFPSRGRWLDYGCGRGAMLQSVSALDSKWELHGFDLDDQHLDYLETIDGFVALHDDLATTTGPVFDVISMVHSLEHFVEPLDVLSKARECLDENGWLFVQVNDTRKNPFEVLVADHLTHFDPHTLSATVSRAGFEVTFVATDWVTKEMSLVARATNMAADSKSADRSTAHDAEAVASQIAWLRDVIKSAREAPTDGPFGLFGSSVAATWLYGHLQDQVTFFVDEDPARVGRQHLGKPIYAPDQLEPGSIVFLGLIPDVATRIYERLRHLPVKFVLPPPLVLPVAAPSNTFGSGNSSS